jgi:hypothetical protein
LPVEALVAVREPLFYSHAVEFWLPGVKEPALRCFSGFETPTCGGGITKNEKHDSLGTILSCLAGHC